MEEYVFERLPKPQVIVLEEHLLACESCQNALVAAEQRIVLIKAASAVAHSSRKTRKRKSKPR